MPSNFLAEVAYSKGISLKCARLRYKRGIKKLQRCLKINETLQTLFLKDVQIRIFKPCNTIIMLRDFLNDEVIKAFNISASTLLYLIVDPKYKAEKLFKLPSEKVQFLRKNSVIVSER